MTRLAHEPDAAAGAWIGRRLAPVGTSIGSVVPLGFEAYARVLHPVELGQGRLMRWADVAAATERAVHPLAQFWRITGRASVHDRGSSAWDDGEPRIGELQSDALRALLDVLAAHSADSAGTECIAALWEGWGWVQGEVEHELVPAADPRARGGIRLVRQPGHGPILADLAPTARGGSGHRVACSCSRTARTASSCGSTSCGSTSGSFSQATGSSTGASMPAPDGLAADHG